MAVVATESVAVRVAADPPSVMEEALEASVTVGVLSLSVIVIETCSPIGVGTDPPDTLATKTTAASLPS